MVAYVPYWHSKFVKTSSSSKQHKTPWASCQIRKIAGCACAGNAGNVFPRRRLQRKPLLSDPGMHHDTCVTHVPWCMSGSFNCGDGKNVPGIPGACAPAILRIWQEAHGRGYSQTCNVRRTKSHNLNVSRLVLQLFLAKPLKPSFKFRMKMWLEQCQQAML